MPNIDETPVAQPWAKPSTKTLLALIIIGLLVSAVSLRYWGRYKFQEGQKSVYDAYSHGQVKVYEETREVFLIGKNDLPNIQLAFGLFKRPVIESNQVVALKDTDELPQVGTSVSITTPKKSTPVLQRDSKTYSDGTPVPPRKDGAIFIPPAP